MKNSWQDFENYLKGLSISKKARSFYISWVKKALSWNKHSPQKPIPENAKKCFIKFLKSRYEP